MVLISGYLITDWSAHIENSPIQGGLTIAKASLDGPMKTLHVTVSYSTLVMTTSRLIHWSPQHLLSLLETEKTQGCATNTSDVRGNFDHDCEVRALLMPKEATVSGDSTALTKRYREG